MYVPGLIFIVLALVVDVQESSFSMPSSIPLAGLESVVLISIFAPKISSPAKLVLLIRTSLLLGSVGVVPPGFSSFFFDTIIVWALSLLSLCSITLATALPSCPIFSSLFDVAFSYTTYLWFSCSFTFENFISQVPLPVPSTVTIFTTGSPTCSGLLTSVMSISFPSRL